MNNVTEVKQDGEWYHFINKTGEMTNQKFTAKNNYVYENEETIYIASENSDAKKIAELMNLLDNSLKNGYTHPTIVEQRYGKQND